MPLYMTGFLGSESRLITHQSARVQTFRLGWAEKGPGWAEFEQAQGAYAEHSLIAKWPIRVTEY